MTLPAWAGLAGDHHVHSTFSDDAESTLAENVAAARQAGLDQIRLVDHVRASTTWVPEFCRRTAALRPTAQGITIRTGVEAKMLDATGRLDLPPGLRTDPDRPDRVGRVLIADHQYPSPVGPWSPSRVLDERAAGLSSDAIVDTLVGAMIGAMAAVEHAQLAHPFSLLPKVGLTEDDLLADHLSALCAAALAHGTWVEINEKWACPGPRAIEAFATAGVTLVASTDSHHHRDVGRYDRVVDLSRSLADAQVVDPLSAGGR
ncbi:PHP domain-containing protein [Pseudonocardia lacus]|uniref:PHP domain-containing protein n=1 Tax=Pseudonocardia lacus TaxID=2835865 RepID=UPI001BDBF075|nr:PHP domain-containing protein [Pseudonocardia lacus]